MEAIAALLGPGSGVGPEMAGAFMLAFARVGTIVMLLPGFGERAIPMRFRAGLAALLALAAMPIVRPGLVPGAASDALTLVPALIGEIAVGLLIGLSVRAISAALASAGHLIAQQAGLSFATTLDPARGAPEPLLAALMSMSGLALVFATDLHLSAIEALYHSYTAFPPLGRLPEGDGAAHLLRAVADGFSLAVRMAAPFLAGGLVVNLAFGVLGKAMPQLQLFQLSLGLSVLVAIGLLLAAIGPMLRLWIGAYGAALAAFAGR